MGRENLSGIAVVMLLALALSACSETSTAPSTEIKISQAKKTVEDPNLAVEIRVTTKLPHPLSKNFATGLNFNGNELQSGHKLMNNPPKRPSPGVRVDVIATPSHQFMAAVPGRCSRFH